MSSRMYKQTVRRSGLTMPIVTARFVDNAWRRGCDFIVLDLEDSVPKHLKAHARTLVRDAIPNVSRGGAEAFVRINHDTVEDDLEGAVWPGLKRVKYPKAEHAEEIRLLDRIITGLEKARGIPEGSIEIDPGIETAVGLINVFDIAGASPRVKEFGASGGGYDLSRDLGVEMFVDFDQFVYAKGEAELAARTLGLGIRAAPFLANPSGSVSDGTRALRQAEAARRCGFHLGNGGLNPAVVESHNAGLTPTEEELRDAQWVLEAYRTVEAADDTWIEIEGRVIDRYESARARDTLEWAALCAVRDEEKGAAVARVKAMQSESA
ncbi:MAG: HpcH/HpaI aldolase/citrate lyase family protein [Burkholderiales bacterium]